VTGIKLRELTVPVALADAEPEKKNS
jgi:hypothetical protein